MARILLVLFGLCGLFWLLWKSWSALLPFQIGMVLAYLILPVVNRLERYMPRSVAIIVVYAFGITVFIGSIAFIVPPLFSQASEALSSLPSLHQIESQATELLDAYEQNVPPEIRAPIDEGVSNSISNIQRNFTTYIQEFGTFLITSSMRLINTVGFVLGFVIVPFWVFYVLKDERAGRDALDRLLPTWMRADFWSVLTIIDRVFSSYIRGQLFLGLVVGLAAWIGLTGLELAGFEIRYSLLLAVIAGVTELIPLVGPVIGAVPAIIMGLFDAPTTAFAIVLLYFTIQQLENNILVPRIIGESVGIHPAVLMIILIINSQVLGFLGIVLSAPIAAVVRDIFVYTHGRLSDPPQPAGWLPGGVLPSVQVPPLEEGVAPPPPPLSPPPSPPPSEQLVSISELSSVTRPQSHE